MMHHLSFEKPSYGYVDNSSYVSFTKIAH